MTKRLLLLGLFCLAATSVHAQALYWQKNVGGGCSFWLGSIEYYPPSPVPRPYHGPSLYAHYGHSRLEGRVLALPWGFLPPGPQAIDRYTIGWIGGSPQPAAAPPPPRPTRYPHTSYIRSYRHTGYARRY